ncbi:hypothetical protein B9J07_12880 [Sinorhizobium sp. LM21]|uniref:hypothetical protein n=1 Tax=Sinorhizobium phage phiLM21 TaxID=1524882 RepID=UPI0004E5E782|nr:hypothetical protein AWJ26_gp15 [Sinorhizobium phage phiLM21]AII27767.1 hypothetical protein phiLM21_p015 [Sinorhizobium phage phiLM21]OWZ93530.1 hypothetical protein B9J07_12880 [Sinorhizobium sp. LM21]
MAFPFREEPITAEEHELIRQASGALYRRCEAVRGQPNEDQVCDEHDAMMRLRRRNEQVEKDLVELTEERDRIERNRDMYRGQVERQSAKIAAMREALQEVEEFFDDRADAEYFTDSAAPHPNKEMTLLTLVRDAIKKAGA